jgi:Inner membrane protein YgaP-like, transmembrane domain
MSALNVGNVDRLLRIVLGLVLIGLVGTDVIGAWGWLGVAPLLTGISARCPVYTAFGVSTTAR